MKCHPNRSLVYVIAIGITAIATLALPPTSSAQEQDTSPSSNAEGDGQTRVVKDPKTLRRWLENMVWYHRFEREEIQQVTGFEEGKLNAMLDQLRIHPQTMPQAEVDPPIFVLPYPGGRHPRIGFLDGAIEPQRDTKLSVFAPWDRNSYLVLDAPEAIWSNLGLTYLAHTHIDTVWSKQGIQLEQTEWEWLPDGSYRQTRVLPNKIAFTVVATPHRDHLGIRMELTNGTEETLTDLRVQMCAMLKGLRGFDEQTNDNKVFQGPFAACRDRQGNRWVIMGFEPNHRSWGNPPCPCLHSDPKIPDCPPGESRHVDGWLSFYQGDAIDQELQRIRQRWNPVDDIEIVGSAVDADTQEPIACRLYVQSQTGTWYFAEPADARGSVVRYEKQNWINASSQEFHSSISAHPFRLRLPPGTYSLVAERGKEYLSWQQTITVDADTHTLTIPLKRWIDMGQRGWYSGDTHVHRPVRQLATPMLADHVNVALPMVYWTTRSDRSAAEGDRTDTADAMLPAKQIHIDPTHVIWPKNTEWEIFTVDQKQHTLGALFAINHRSAFGKSIPPVRDVMVRATREGALLDLDKHDWPFAMALPPFMHGHGVYELANNHMWRTEFAFKKWSTPSPDWMGLPDPNGGEERDWIEFTHRTYWCLLNAGYRLQPTAGTATGVHPVPIGFGRVYVQVPGAFDYDRWIEGLRNGRSFVTTGPMLFLSDEFKTFRATVHSDHPVDSLEWIVNGRIVRTEAPNNEGQIDGSYVSESLLGVDEDRTTWTAVRVWQRAGDGRWRFAHSAPIWKDMPGKPLIPSADEVEFLTSRVESEMARSRELLSDEAVREYQEAIDQYRKLREESR